VRKFKHYYTVIGARKDHKIVELMIVDKGNGLSTKGSLETSEWGKRSLFIEGWEFFPSLTKKEREAGA
jgi:hypothetical protein